MCLGPEETSLTFGTDPDTGDAAGYVGHLKKTNKQKKTFCIHFSGNNSCMWMKTIRRIYVAGTDEVVGRGMHSTEGR